MGCKKTKIICSIGPASNQPDVMEKMVEAGMNIARLNFSHATAEEKQQFQDCVREVRKRTGKNISILWDTKGPELRGCVMEADSEGTEGAELVVGKTIRLVKEEVIGNAERITFNHPSVIEGLEVGDEVWLENAKMKVVVESVESDGVTCRITQGGFLGSRKSCIIPGKPLNIPYVSDKDREDIKYSCEHGGEYLAISFVSNKENIMEIKELLKQHGREDLKIICKVESLFGVQNIVEIFENSDGVMIGRGDLGSEVPPEEIPAIQKNIIRTAREMGKIVIVATEMLETMMENNRPKRAEVSDIANAVFDGVKSARINAFVRKRKIIVALGVKVGIKPYIAAVKELFNQSGIAFDGNALILIVEIVIVILVPYGNSFNNKRGQIRAVASPLLFGIAFYQLFVNGSADKGNRLLFKVFGLGRNLFLFIFYNRPRLFGSRHAEHL